MGPRAGHRAEIRVKRCRTPLWRKLKWEGEEGETMCPEEEVPSQRNRMQRGAGSSSSLEEYDRHHEAELGVDWLDLAMLLGEGVGGTKQQAEIGDSSADLRLTGAFGGTGTCQQFGRQC